MKGFLDQHFLLQTPTAQRLYHDFAKEMPVIDYHNHLPADQIASDKCFDNITQAWLYGDHYKWRAMRANGVHEKYCTGNANDWEKFQQWAATVPYTLRNPLYHWTHLELQRYFDIHDVLNKDTGKKIYDNTAAKLQSPDFSVRNLLRRMKVRVVCTTDDPLDSLEHHLAIAEDNFEIKVVPAFRPDKAMQVDDLSQFNEYAGKLEAITNTDIRSFDAYLNALKSRHDYFASRNCVVSDHGLDHLYADNYTDQEIKLVFDKLRSRQEVTTEEKNKFRSAMLYHFALWDWEKGWVQQFHVGALRNNNSRMLKATGPDSGWDSMGDHSQAIALSKFLNRLDSTNQLAKTIIYNLNPSDNEVFATMTGNFNDGSYAGKIQFGSGWWFMDQKEGMTRQLNALSNMGLISRFIGMLTDSRSFLSFPRHEYFRRILCDLFGSEMEKGELPGDIAWIGKMIQDISYNNAAGYFNWKEVQQPALAK